MKIDPKDTRAALAAAVAGMARLQARQEAMECFVRALIVETPPAHPLFWTALDAAQSDLAHRSGKARPENPPEIDAHALKLLNVLRAACAPPTEPGTSA